MKIVYRYIPPATVLYARAIGPYATGTVEAWRTLSHWLNAQNARSCMRVSYGLFRDNPRRTPAEILRYDACVPLGIGLEEDPAAGIQRQTLLGGTFGVHTHIGGFETTGQLFSRL